MNAVGHVDLMAWPNGRRCCICFEGFDKADLYTDPDGTTWDVCQACHLSEVSDERLIAEHDGDVRAAQLCKRGKCPLDPPHSRT